MASSFSHETSIPAPVADVFEFHRRTTALQRLTPPWESVEILGKEGGIENEGTTLLKVGGAFFKTRWKAVHSDYVENRQFVDSQLSGPFKSWKHTHAFRPVSEKETILNDSIAYQLPMGVLGGIASGFVRRQLERMFVYRHTITQNDLRHYVVHSAKSRLRIAITGGNGLIGSALSIFLSAQGHEVVILSRSGKSKVFGISGVRWNPTEEFIDSESLGSIDAWIHLAGENIADKRWTSSRKQSLKASRVNVTRFLVKYILAQDEPPEVFVSASGTGFYGSTEFDTSESSGKGAGFLADLCEKWEGASDELDKAGIRRVLLRTGVVLDKRGGALAKLLPAFRLGLGGRVGSGQQFWSWIAMDDLLRIYDETIINSELKGVYNAVAPEPLKNIDFVVELGSVLKRPTIFPVPRAVLKIALGQMAEEALLTGQKVVPERLEDSGFQFDFPTLNLALRHCLGRY